MKTLYIYVNNHFDPTWRRCWLRRFTWKGQTYVSYADLQEYYLLDNLTLARVHPGYKFEAESAIVARTFLERHPELREELVALAQAGRFAVTGGGECIVDANMVLGESLVRNYLGGLLWVEETFGRATRLAVRNDAFGNSAQLPQILRGCEIAWATGMSYSPVIGRYWRGLDGSTLLDATLPTAASGGGNFKYPPCPICHGIGESSGILCPACGGRGIDSSERAWLPREVHASALEDTGAAWVRMTPEELLPNPDLIAWAQAQRDRYDVRFALQEDVLPHIRPWLDAVDDPPEEEVHPGLELNPNNTGCLVTRCKTKQTVRRQEYALLGVETLCVLAALRGRPYPAGRVNEVWRKLFFCMFHDAITATHVDPAYAELQTFWSEIDAHTAALREGALGALVAPEAGTISVLNPGGQPATQVTTAVVPAPPHPWTLEDEAGQPVPVLDVSDRNDGTIAVDFVAVDVPAFGARTYRLRQAEAGPERAGPLPAPNRAVIENGRFRVEADAHGLRTIWDKRLGRAIAQANGCRPGELILEHDEGSPWATLSADQSRTPLAPYTRLETVTVQGAVSRLTFAVETPREMGLSGQALRARVTVTLTEGIERVDFHVHAHWDAFNHRLRVGLPVTCSGGHRYEIPYGSLVRRSYEPTFGWAGANGDWPALNWAGVEGAGGSVALLNRGLPSYRIEPGERGDVILLSLLRSPTIPTYLHEPEFYTMTDWDGMRDAGQHAFDFAVAAYDVPLADSDVVRDAEGYNAGLLAVAGRVDLPALPAVRSAVARAAALKWAEREKALVLRLCEYRGRGGEVTIVLPEGWTGAARVNLLERQAEHLPVTDRRLTLTLRPWEIATVLCRPG